MNKQTFQYSSWDLTEEMSLKLLKIINYCGSGINLAEFHLKLPST